MAKITWFALITLLAMLIGGGLTYLFLSTPFQSEVDGYYERSDATMAEAYGQENAVMTFLVVVIFFAPVVIFDTTTAYVLWPAKTKAIIKRIVG